MVQMLVAALLTLGVVARGDDAGCTAEGGSCSISGPSMVQMKSARRAKQQSQPQQDDLLPVVVVYRNEVAKQHAAGADATGNPEVFAKLHGETLLVTEEKLAELQEDPDLIVSLASEQHVALHSRGKVFRSRDLEDEKTPWGITRVRAPELVPGDHNVKVCVIDTGYDLGHEDLPGQQHGVAGLSTREQWGPWDEDVNGHGTHVAGTIGAIGGNGKGVTSVIPDPTKFSFYVAKAFDEHGFGTNIATLAGLEGCLEAGAQVVSMSLGGAYHEADAELYQEAYDNGVLLVAAAGNNGHSSMSYPASYGSVISVGATDEHDNITFYSQTNTQVELAAPGDYVLSTSSSEKSDEKYEELRGTSMATPHVAGVAALVWSHFPACTNHQIRGALLLSAEDLGAPGYDENFGYGMVNAKGAYDLLKAGGCDAGGPAQGSAAGGLWEREHHFDPSSSSSPLQVCDNNCRLLNVKLCAGSGCLPKRVACEWPWSRRYPECKMRKKGVCHGRARIGRGDRWSAWKDVQGEFVCSTWFFGPDPWRGKMKECECDSSGAANLLQKAAASKEMEAQAKVSINDAKGDTVFSYVFNTEEDTHREWRQCLTKGRYSLSFRNLVGVEYSVSVDNIQLATGVADGSDSNTLVPVQACTPTSPSLPAAQPPFATFCANTCSQRALKFTWTASSSRLGDSLVILNVFDAAGELVSSFTSNGRADDEQQVREHVECLTGQPYSFSFFAHGEGEHFSVSFMGEDIVKQQPFPGVFVPFNHTISACDSGA